MQRSVCSVRLQPRVIHHAQSLDACRGLRVCQAALAAAADASRRDPPLDRRCRCCYHPGHRMLQ